MAAPPNVTTKVMTGKFIQNKSLSDSPDEILRFQGVSWFKRSAISMFTPTLCITHTTDDAGVEHIDIVQTLSGGPSFTLKENHILDLQERDVKNDLFGFVTGRSRRISAEEITDPFLKKDWSQDTIDDGIVLCDFRNTLGKNSYTWNAIQAWGFAVVNGKRRYVQHTTFTSPQKKDGPIHTRFVYDYIVES